MSLQHIPGTCTRNIFMCVQMLWFCPCYMSPLHVPAACRLSVHYTSFLSLQHVAAACPCNMTPRVWAPWGLCVVAMYCREDSLLNYMQQNFFAKTGMSHKENCRCNMSPLHVPAKCLQTHFINGVPIKILLYAFKLASLNSFESKNSFELSTRKRG